MATQQFMGRGQLINRLTAQVGSREAAIALLQKRGHLKADGKTFTAAGQRRNEMTAAERAIDRASKATGKPKGEFSYNAKTNTAKSIRNI